MKESTTEEYTTEELGDVILNVAVALEGLSHRLDTIIKALAHLTLGLNKINEKIK